MKNYISCFSESEIIDNDEEVRTQTFNRFDVSLKKDMEFKVQDQQLNSEDIQDLEDKMKSLTNETFRFKTLCKQSTPQKTSIFNVVQNNNQELQTFKKPIQPRASSRLSLDLSSNRSTSKNKQEKCQKLLSDHRKQFKGNTLANPVGNRLEHAVSPNRFCSRKRSQFSYQGNSNSNLDVSIESNFQPIQRKERSINVTTTIQVLEPNYDQNNNVRLVRKLQNKQRDELEQFQIKKRNSASSSISTPKSILKTPSYGSSQIELRLNSVQSRNSISSLNINQMPQKRKVKFCLTKKQARREHLPC